MSTPVRGRGAARPARDVGGLRQTVARKQVMKRAHSSRLMIRAGPSGFLESRTATMPGRLRATSMQLPPLPLLRVDLRHTARDRSASTSHPLCLGQVFGTPRKEPPGLIQGQGRRAKMLVNESISGYLVGLLQIEGAGRVLEVDDVAVGGRVEAHDRKG